MITRRRQPDIPRPEPLARRQQHVTGGKILPGTTNMPAHGRRFGNSHPIAIAVGVFLDHNPIGAVRQHAAGKQPQRLARAQHPNPGMPGRRRADHTKPRAQRRIACPHGVAIHRRYVAWRLGQAGMHRGGGHPVPGLGERDDFGGGGVECGEDAGAGFGDGDHGRALSKNVLFVNKKNQKNFFTHLLRLPCDCGEPEPTARQ